MKSKGSTLLFLLGILFALSSCSGVKNPCTNCTPTGNATLNLTLSDTPPAGASIISFTLPISGISLTPSTGSPVSVFSGGSFELTRLQTDSTPVALGVSVPSGSYTAINVTVGTSTGIFINASGGAIGSCAVNTICSLPNGAATTITVPLTLTLTGNQTQWIGLDINLNNAITSTNGIGVDFTQTNVLTALTTPRVNVPSGTVDSIDDFTGLVTAYTSGSTIAVKSGTRGSLTATITTNTTYDDPQNLCAAASSIASCISSGAIVSVQAALTTAGAVNAVEIDVIDTSATATDEIEGFIYPSSCNNGNNFGLVLADSAVPSGNAVLTGLTFGAGFCLTLNPTAPFLADTGLLSSVVGGASQAGFQSANDLFAGQVVRVHVSNVTAGTLVSATANTVLLRYSRLSGTVNTVSASNFSVNGLPTYLGFTLSPIVATYLNNTIFEGVTGTTDANFSGASVAFRALYLNPTTAPNAVPFLAAKVRVP